MPNTHSSLTDCSHTFQALGLSRRCPLATCEASLQGRQRDLLCGHSRAFSSAKALRFPPNPHAPRDLEEKALSKGVVFEKESNHLSLCIIA